MATTSPLYARALATVALLILAPPPLVLAQSTDADGDGAPDAIDNCTLVANNTGASAQCDVDGDGYGNACDGDLNQSGLTTSTDFNLLRSCLNLPASTSALCAAADMNCSGVVTSSDYSMQRATFNQAPGPSAAGSSGFAFPASVSSTTRKFLDQNGAPFLLMTMASWSMSQNCTDAEITQALEGLAALGFNAVTVAPFGVHQNNSFGNRFQNLAGQEFFTGAPYASSFGPAWASMDHVVAEATRLRMTVVFSIFLASGDNGTTLQLIDAGTSNAYAYGRALAARYAAYPNIVWHVMGDFQWFYGEGPAVALDALFHGIRDQEGARHRLIIAEPQNGNTGLEQFISQEGPSGYQWFRQSADELYDYGNSAVFQFDAVYAGTTGYPVVDIEPPYVNSPHYEGDPDQQLRERNYSTFIRGGAGINFGHEKWWPFGRTGLYDGGPGWLAVLGEPPQRQAGYAWSLLDDVVRSSSWTPDDGAFLKVGLGSGDTRAASGYSQSSAAAYFPSSRPVSIDTTALAAPGSVRLRWYDPTAGTWSTIAAAEAKTASRPVTYPANHGDGTSDWVLVVDVP